MVLVIYLFLTLMAVEKPIKLTSELLVSYVTESNLRTVCLIDAGEKTSHQDGIEAIPIPLESNSLMAKIFSSLHNLFVHILGHLIIL